MLELISKFDPFLKHHFDTFGNKGHVHTSYFSANISKELIEVMSKSVKLHRRRIKKGQILISVDSTPDVSRVDQLTFTIRYVTYEGSKERFLKYISLGDCRGQSYDNAANMSGQYTGLQARSREQNKYADLAQPLIKFSRCQSSTKMFYAN